MPRQLHLEGPALETLLEQARADHGGRLRVVGAHRVRRGGVAGFFTREHYEVTIEVADPTKAALPGPSTLEQLIAAADRADGADTPLVPSRVEVPALVGAMEAPAEAVVRLPGRTLSTESPGFDEVLAALRADLLGPGSTRDEAAAGLTTQASRGGVPASWVPSPATPWQPVTVLDDAETPEPSDQVVVTEPAVTEPSDQVAVPDPTAVAEPTAGAADAPALDAAAVGGLVGLALAVGADPVRATAAAQDVASSGVTRLCHALPLLATALADDLALDGPDDDPLGARAGDVVVVMGAPHRAATTAAEVARALGTSWLACWSDEPGPLDHMVLRDSRALPGLASRARAAGQPVVLALCDPTLGDGVVAAQAGTGRAGLLRSLDPDLVVLVVDADSSCRRQHAVTGRVDQVVRSIQRSLALALVGCDQAAAPLSHAAWPVALLDGRPATRGTWTGVLLDALRSADVR